MKRLNLGENLLADGSAGINSQGEILLANWPSTIPEIPAQLKKYQYQNGDYTEVASVDILPRTSLGAQEVKENDKKEITETGSYLKYTMASSLVSVSSQNLQWIETVPYVGIMRGYLPPDDLVFALAIEGGYNLTTFSGNYSLQTDAGPFQTPYISVTQTRDKIVVLHPNSMLVYDKQGGCLTIFYHLLFIIHDLYLTNGQ